MDSKGRIVIPRVFADFLGTGGYVTKGVDGCLSLLTETAFVAEASGRLEEARSGGPDARKAARSFASSAALFTLDKARRIPLPQELREFASLDHQCVVIGNLDRIEIWDAPTWREIEAAGDQTLTAPEAAS